MLYLFIAIHIAIYSYLCHHDVVTYFDNFGIAHNPEEVEKFIDNKVFRTNIYRTLAYDSTMCGYFYFGLFYVK